MTRYLRAWARNAPLSFMFVLMMIETSAAALAVIALQQSAF